MDEQRFDQLSRRFAASRTRRQALKAIAGAVVATITGATSANAQSCTAHYSPCGSDGECCGGSVCEYGLCMPGCRIDGVFFTAWMSSPENICGQCQPEASTTTWVPANEGMSCWSGDPNAGVTTCQAGVCTGSGPATCSPPPRCYTEELVDPATCTYAAAPAGTPCGKGAFCFGEFFQPADACDGAGVCIGGGSQSVPCAPYVCGTGACTTSCASDADCASGAHCDDGQCFPDEDLGAPCDENGDCRSGICVAGVCCAKACKDPKGGRAICVDNGARCDFTCNPGFRACNGRCVPKDACCSDSDCPPAPMCSTFTCDTKTGACIESFVTNGKPCDDGDRCTDASTCQDGVCVGQPRVCGGVINVDPCTVDLDVCDPEHGCVRLLPDGTVCSPVPPNPDPTLNWACQAGACTPTQCPADECHISYADGQGGCSPQEPLPTGASCDDGDPCTTGDICVNFGDRASCEGGTGWACDIECGAYIVIGNAVPPPGAAVYQRRPEGYVCSEEPINHSACAPTLACSDGYCLPKFSPDNTPCEDEDNCILVGSCQSGTCQPVILAPDGARCFTDACSVSGCFSGVCQEVRVVEGRSCGGNSDCCPGTYCVMDEGTYADDWHCYTCESTLGRSCDPWSGDDPCCPDQECGCSGAATCGYGIGWECMWRDGYDPDDE